MSGRPSFMRTETHRLLEENLTKLLCCEESNGFGSDYTVKTNEMAAAHKLLFHPGICQFVISVKNDSKSRRAALMEANISKYKLLERK